MDETKSWYASKTIWASVLQVAVGIAVSLGVISDTAGNSILAEGPELIVGIATSLLGAWGLYGRVSATKQIST